MRKMGIGSRAGVFALMFLCSGLLGCGQEQETVSDNYITMEEVLSGEVSENVIPVEAQIATVLTLDIPENFRASLDNTENKQTYVSEMAEDHSYICYLRTDCEEGIDYLQYSQEDYASALSADLGVDVTIDSLLRENEQGYEKLTITMHYTSEDISYETTEYIYFTERYNFSVVYAMDTRADWADRFMQSAETITLKNTVMMMEEREAEDEETVSSNG
ncbi:MAG: hypothetical protein ACI4DU_07065 [Lachnospiraceae bacterium]